MIPKDIHIQYMRMALNLAKEGQGRTTPNPCVGCVIVNDGEIISTARSGDFGSPHAEVSAIRKAEQNNLKEKLVGADLYVTLEPCSHHGVNPPCADAIIASGVKRVFIANHDPNPLVNGGGVEKLKAANIEVIENILHDEVAEFNIPFFKRMIAGKPYVTLKLATSLDGKIALKSGESKWITSEQARKYAQMLRLRNDAIMVGVGTVLADNPRLDLRLEGLEKFSPALFIIDSRLKLKSDANVFNLNSDSEKTRKNHIICRQSAYDKTESKIDNVEYITAKVEEDKNICGHFILKNIAKLKYSSLLIEGGANTAGYFLKQNLVDEIQLIISPKILGSDGIQAISGLEINKIEESGFVLTETKKLDCDTLLIFKKPISF